MGQASTYILPHKGTSTSSNKQTRRKWLLEMAQSGWADTKRVHYTLAMQKQAHYHIATWTWRRVTTHSEYSLVVRRLRDLITASRDTESSSRLFSNVWKLNHASKVTYGMGNALDAAKICSLELFLHAY